MRKRFDWHVKKSLEIEGIVCFILQAQLWQIKILQVIDSTY